MKQTQGWPGFGTSKPGFGTKVSSAPGMYLWPDPEVPVPLLPPVLGVVKGEV